MSSAVSLSVVDVIAPDQDWHDIGELFVACFSAAPYLEDPEELRTIRTWGPAMLAGDGRLVTARIDGNLVGFGLAHNLSHDPSWQRTMSSLADGGAPVAPAGGWVVHELAVRDTERGRGIARACLRELVRDRPESRTLVGTYERAEGARAMYLRWGFTPVGRVPMRGDAIALHVLSGTTAGVFARLAGRA